MSDMTGEVTHLKWQSVKLVVDTAAELERNIALGQALKFEAVAQFALAQKSKATALDILSAPLTELKSGKLKCSSSDIQPAMLAEAQKLQK